MKNQDETKKALSVSTVITEVLFTEDLSIFKNLEYNREIEPRVKNIVHSMKHDGLKMSPIIVDRFLNVIDGKHRLFAATIVKKGIYFIIDESCNSLSDSEETMITLNRNTNSWGKFKFLSYYHKKGLKSYVTLYNFKKEFKDFSLTDCMMMLNNNSNYPSQYDNDFENGKWKCNDVKKAREWANFLLNIRPSFPDGFKRAIFVRTMLTILSKYPDFSMEHFLHKCSISQHKLSIQGDRKSYVRMIEDVYNFKTKESNKIFLRL